MTHGYRTVSGSTSLLDKSAAEIFTRLSLALAAFLALSSFAAS